MAEVTKWEWEQNAKEQEEAYEKMQEYAKATGKLQITVLTPEQRMQWAATFQPVHKKFESVIGKDLLDIIPGLAKLSPCDPSKSGPRPGSGWRLAASGKLLDHTQRIV